MIRQATVDDAPAIAAIHVRTWQIAYAGIVPADYLAGLSISQRTGFWHQQLVENRNPVFVAVESGEVVGWVSGGACRDPDAKAEAEVYAVYVQPELWSRGIGRQLMKQIEEAMAPSADIVLWVLAQNQRARDFYDKLGYKFGGAEKTVQLGGASLAEIRLRRKGPG